MSKHITDHTNDAGDRPDRLLDAKHRAGDQTPHPASKAVHRRETVKSRERMKQFARIERGHTA